MNDNMMDPEDAFEAARGTRARKAEEAMSDNVERAMLGAQMAARSKMMRQMLVVLSKREGRVRFSRRELEGLDAAEGFAVREEGDNVFVTYRGPTG